MSGGWIGSADALLRDRHRAGSGLVDLAADGLIRTRAAAFIDGRREPQRDVELPPDFWRVMQRMTGSAYRDWQTGTFQTVIADWVTGIMPFNNRRAVGVGFHLGDLDVYLPASITSGAQDSSQPQITAEKLPPLPEGKLRQWWEKLTSRLDHKALTAEELMSLVLQAHPGYSVSRDRLRDVRGGLKTGPKA